MSLNLGFLKKHCTTSKFIFIAMILLLFIVKKLSSLMKLGDLKHNVHKTFETGLSIETWNICFAVSQNLLLRETLQQASWVYHF